MAKRRRIPKKKLKEPDEFISTTARILSWTVENLKLLLIGIIICALIVLSVVFWRIRARNRELDALNVFHRASEMLMSAEDPSSKGYQEAIDELERIKREYAHTDVVELAQLQLGQGFLNTKQYDKAVESYRKLLDRGPRERLYRLLALQNLGYAYEGQGDYQKALDSFQSLVAKGESFLQPWGYLNVSRCYEKLGKREEALKTYRIFLEKFPDSTMGPLIRS
ncbi:MAG: tetratricopeptide repeat protein, partial [Proteobacteria bacterium]|nr:tetratricopeptide repeat protein [Pseudomonadota bacterium]